MDKKPKISVVIVTYNAGAFLQTALNSIYKQRYCDIEIIIIDGLSKDNTPDILKANADKIAICISEKDKGIFDAMNKAVKVATGDFIYFLGADDYLYDAFSDLANQLADPNTIYYGNVMMGPKKTGAVKSPYQLAKTNICHQAIIYPKAIFEKYQYDLNYPIDADHFLNISVWNDKLFYFKYFDITIAYYSITGSSSIKTDVLFEKKRFGIIYKYFGLSAWARYVFRVFRVNTLSRKKNLPG